MSEEVLEPTGETPTVVQALSAVMADVRAVAKKERNTSQGGGFYFRGIDAVVNAVGPALRTHGVVVTPHLDNIDRREGRTSKGGTLNYVAVIVTYTFTGPAGDTMTATVPGEAFDSGDKATAKAMSVAFRTCLLQALTLPTDEADPDADVYDATVQTAAPTAGPTTPGAPDVVDLAEVAWTFRLPSGNIGPCATGRETTAVVVMFTTAGLTWATMSATFFKPLAGCVASTCSDRPISATGRKSFKPS